MAVDEVCGMSGATRDLGLGIASYLDLEDLDARRRFRNSLSPRMAHRVARLTRATTPTCSRKVGAGPSDHPVGKMDSTQRVRCRLDAPATE
jgi:hypothetical protein